MIFVISDRKVIDKQLQDQVKAIEKKKDLVQKIEDNSKQLAEAIKSGTNIVVSTIHKFSWIVDEIADVEDRTYAIIVDEAHNILSTTSIRESEEWKDYRLECFEEIIKEGRKFGTFLTISSQRPSDISYTIISQLHNYFIHRLVNEEDLRKIHRTIAFSDKSTNDMISILPAGGCIFTGLASNFPVLARINILPEANQPRSENVDISKIWY